MGKERVGTIVERWGSFELVLNGPDTGNPFLDIRFGVKFRYKNRILDVDGFYDGGGVYKARCMPDAEGVWSYETESNCRELDGVTGEFHCAAPSAGNHGPVRVNNGYHFCYADGSRYLPFGTTCYVWNHQGGELERKTLETLKAAPFNKMRMCVFPKHYLFNDNEPEYYPFEGSLEQGFDFTRFNPAFFRHLEGTIEALLNLGIECDLILFHAYDRWGFSKMAPEADDRYLKYLVARLAAYRNIWWSLANEYDLMLAKTMSDWDRFFHIIQRHDPYQHLRSIHNCRPFYDHGKPWVTHCSIQHNIQHNDAAMVPEWRNLYQKPVVIDECKYEGNIHRRWGNITAQEMVCRFWIGFSSGGYVGHGETYLHPQDILWWAKGGKLYGESPARIGFLRKIMEEGPAQGLAPADLGKDSQAVGLGGVKDEYFLLYHGIDQPAYQVLELPEGKRYRIDIIDTWEMTVTPAPGVYEGHCRVELPGKQYIALRIQKIKAGA